MQRFKRYMIEEVTRSAMKKFFDVLEDAPVTEDIEELEEIYWGGVADFGDNRAADVIWKAQGALEYQSYIWTAAQRYLGGEFPSYRLMSRDDYEDWANGTPPVSNMSASLSKQFARKFKNFAGFRGDKSNLILVEIPTWHHSLVMRGKASEYEVVLAASDIDMSNSRVLD